MLKKLFEKNRNPWQTIGAAVGAFLGLFLLLLAMQIYFDFQKILRGSNEGDNYLTINKPVSIANTIFGKSVFTPENIQEIEANAPSIGVESVGKFTANRFKVSASSKMLGFYTELFFEALPESFLDIQDPAFRWHEGQGEVPIIMSKDYLALYNFGFALSQGLPQFTPATIRQVTVDVTLHGFGREQTFTGRIIGFSERVNSILVPESFIAFANTNFGDQPMSGVSRLLMKVKNPYDKNLTAFLNDKGYELSSGRLAGGRLATVLNAIVFVISGIGIVLMILSLIVFVLNYQLIISKSAPDIKLLLQIGYRASQITEILRGSIFRLLGSVFLAVVVAMAVVRWWILTAFEQQGFKLETNYHAFVWVVGIVLMALILVINGANIRKNVAREF